jgi:GTP 3',8-cyclase
MFDSYGRKIEYLRISVTDRCNLNCTYCKPVESDHLFCKEEILSYDEMFRIAEAASDLGFTKYRITGGEPLVRKNLVSFMGMMSGLKNLKDLSITTNGILLEEYAQPLINAGLHRINISLDTMNPERYREITGGGDINRVLAGIRTAKEVGFENIKINCVVEESSSEPDAKDIARFASENNLQARFIRRMNIAEGKFWTVENGSGGDCKNCNRIRVSSTGLVWPCLFSDTFYDSREMGAAEALTEAIRCKPEKGGVRLNNNFYNVGG